VAGGLRYTPTVGYTGSDSFSYTVTDNRGGTATATVSLTVQAAPPTQVTVVNGRLVITGSSARDVVSITGVGNGASGQYVVVTNQGTQTVSGIVGDMEINLLEGDDEVVIDNALVNGNIIINTSAGNDEVSLGLEKIVSTRFGLNVTLSDGDDVLNGQRLYIGGNQTISGGAGDDQLLFLGAVLPTEFVLGTSSGGATTISGDDGIDEIRVVYAFVVGQWQLNGGADNDTVDVRGSACNGAVTVNGNAGVDTLVIDTNYFVATLLISGGSENDRLELRNSLGITTAMLDGGAGNDAAMVNNLTCKLLSLTLGSQNDTADVRSSLFDELFAALGSHDDTLTVYGNLARRASLVDGGSGTDAFFDLGNTYLGGLQRINFER
jgi:hypothetical protein